MAVPWNVMNKIRSKLREVLKPGDPNETVWRVDPGDEKFAPDLAGKDLTFDQAVDERFFTFDRDNQQIVSNIKFRGWHFIFDLDGNLIKHHQD